MISRAIFLKWALNVGELKQKLEKAEVDIKQQGEFYVSTTQCQQVELHADMKINEYDLTICRAIELYPCLYMCSILD